MVNVQALECESAQQFDFSVVVAVYNVEEYLEETIESVIKQDIGFEDHIQLILVDDGSSDSSGDICDKYAAHYPNNITVLHKENGGVASARNLGVTYATGRLINFLDSDDLFSENTFSRVADFYQAHEEETDVVAVPMFFFGTRSGAHWQNDKFQKGSRVIDLFWSSEATLMSVSSSFYSCRVKDLLVFDDRLVVGEDQKVCLTVLANKMTMGVVARCKYMYRRRESGSRIQSQHMQPGWYFDYFTCLIDWACDYYQAKYGFVPEFVQYQLMADLQWRFTEFKEDKLPLESIDLESYKAALFAELKRFDDKIILAQKMISRGMKCYLLSLKHGGGVTLLPRPADAIVHWGNTLIGSPASSYVGLDFCQIHNDTANITGLIKPFGLQLETTELYAQVDDKLYPCALEKRPYASEMCFGETVTAGLTFTCQVPLDEDGAGHVISFCLKVGDAFVPIKKVNHRYFMPFSSGYAESYYFSENWICKANNKGVWYQRCGRKGRLSHELLFMRELVGSKRASDKKAACARLLYHVLRLFKKKPVWLISDRILKADDNGEAFFSYMRKAHPEIDAYFLLGKESSDYERLKKAGHVVEPLSFKHKLLHLLCDFNISSQADDITDNPFQEYCGPYKDLYAHSNFVFLQHGVISADLSKWLSRYNKNLYGFVVTAIPEAKSIANYDYSYTDKEIWLTGLPRFDRLRHDEQKLITIMPTWRNYLVSRVDPKTGTRELREGFEQSDFFQFYNALLNDERLLAAAEEKGYTIQFFPHPLLQPHVERFDRNEKVRFLKYGTRYSDVYATSDLIVSDYSSAVYDFLYLRKPIVYCQFDSEVFFSGQHTYTKGYFDYKRDGFGEIEVTVDGAVDRIIEYINNGCQLKPMYRERLDAFFAYSDAHNCERVYDAIMNKLHNGEDPDR